MAGFRPVDPKQSFPELEERILERWRERDVFHRSLANRESAPLWGFYEGPPTANGRPGSHHVLARVFKDIYPRFRTMSGNRVPRKAGWDCHGLPVELEVEREVGITSKEEIEDYGIAEFNQRCRESVFRYVEEWNRLTERIGFWIDLDDAYVTMTNEYIESVWWALRRIWDDGRLYEAYKVVPYCPRDGTALSSHEVALGYHDVEDPSVYVKLPVRQPAPSDAIPESPLEPGDQLLVWTTTPWTLITNAAVAAGPEIEYVRARLGDEVFVLARDRVEHALGEDAEVLAHFPGEALAGTSYEPPFDYITDYGPRGHTVLLADFVTTDEGTGLVHTAIAFGEDDFRLGEQYGIKLQNPVDDRGRFDERITDFAGRFVKEADQDIIKALEENGKLLRAETYLHAYPHCWRCDTPLLYYAKSSWYVKTTEVRDRLLAANEEIGWHPEHIKHGRFGKWLEGNVDWALSRDRYWGTPLPIWECDAADCDERFCAGSVADVRDRAAPRSRTTSTVLTSTRSVWACEREGCDGTMRRVASVIDAWFDSGSMPWAQFHYPFENEELFEERFPADFICEAIDQTRGWFYTLLAESVLLFDTSSYRNVVCLGLILDPEGQKMSKSRGNVVEPWDVINRHGADAFRWYYFASKQPWAGYRFSVDTVGRGGPPLPAHALEHVRVLGHLRERVRAWRRASCPTCRSGPRLTGRRSPSSTAGRSLACSARSPRSASRWTGFDCTTAARAIADYTEELSNWYVRLNRRRFWDGDFAALETLRFCLGETAKLLAPFTPFVADEIYANLLFGEETGLEKPVEEWTNPEPDSIHLADYPVIEENLIDAQLEAGMDAVRRTIELGRAARAQAKVKLRQPLRKAIVVASDAEREAIERLADVVASELNVKELDFVRSEAELVSYGVKPNYRSLGPRFGKNMPQVAAAVEALDAGGVAEQLEAGADVGIAIDGKEHTLTADDINLVMEPLEGYQLEAEAGHAVALELDLDDELRREGLAREVVRAVQEARKQAGLDVSDRISLELGGDDELLDAAREHESYIAGETLATSVDYGADGAGEKATIEGRELRIALSKA